MISRLKGALIEIQAKAEAFNARSQKLDQMENGFTERWAQVAAGQEELKREREALAHRIDPRLAQLEHLVREGASRAQRLEEELRGARSEALAKSQLCDELVTKLTGAESKTQSVDAEMRALAKQRDDLARRFELLEEQRRLSEAQYKAELERTGRLSAEVAKAEERLVAEARTREVVIREMEAMRQRVEAIGAIREQLSRDLVHQRVVAEEHATRLQEETSKSQQLGMTLQQKERLAHDTAEALQVSQKTGEKAQQLLQASRDEAAQLTVALRRQEQLLNQTESYAHALESPTSFGVVGMDLLRQVAGLLGGVLRQLPQFDRGKRGTQGDLYRRRRFPQGGGDPDGDPGAIVSSPRPGGDRKRAHDPGGDAPPGRTPAGGRCRAPWYWTWRSTVPGVDTDPGELELIMVNLVLAVAALGQENSPISIASFDRDNRLCVTIGGAIHAGGAAPAVEIVQFEPRAGLSALMPILCKQLLARTGSELQVEVDEDTRLQLKIEWRASRAP